MAVVAVAAVVVASAKGRAVVWAEAAGVWGQAEIVSAAAAAPRYLMREEYPASR